MNAVAGAEYRRLEHQIVNGCRDATDPPPLRPPVFVVQPDPMPDVAQFRFPQQPRGVLRICVRKPPPLLLEVAAAHTHTAAVVAVARAAGSDGHR